MRNCFNGIVLPFLLTAIFILTAFESCTSVDDMLGRELLPDDQEVEFLRAKLDGINSYMTMPDSLPSSRLNLLYLGSLDTDGFGRIENNPIVQFSPANYTHKGYYGYKPHVDSVKFEITISKVYGDASQSQKFYIYKVEEPLRYDSLYFPNFDPEAVSDMSAPLFSFTMEDEKAGVLTKKLNVEPAGEQYLRDLAGVDAEVYEKVDTVFRDLFRGWYIAASKDPSEYPATGGALYEINPVAVFTGYSFIDYFVFTVYAHSHKEEPDEEDELHLHGAEFYATQDTLYVSYSFDDSNIAYPNTSINAVKHDYSSYPAAPSNLVDASLFIEPRTFKDDNPPHQDVFYVQGLMGVAGYLDLEGGFTSQLENLCYNDKGERCIMKVNKAKLIIWLEDDQPHLMHSAPFRLGMFSDYRGYTPVSIRDYSYLSEIMYNDVSTYGGLLNRSFGYYEMDISKYVSDLANKPGETAKQLWLAPVDVADNINNVHYSPLNYAPYGVALQNKWTNPSDPDYAKRIQVELSYTLLKKSE